MVALYLPNHLNQLPETFSVPIPHLPLVVRDHSPSTMLMESGHGLVKEGPEQWKQNMRGGWVSRIIIKEGEDEKNERRNH